MNTKENLSKLFHTALMMCLALIFFVVKVPEIAFPLILLYLIIEVLFYEGSIFLKVVMILIGLSYFLINFIN